MLYILNFIFFLSAFKLMWKNSEHDFGEFRNEIYYQQYYDTNLIICFIWAFYAFLIHVQIILCSIIFFFIPEDKQLLFLILSALPECSYSIADKFIIWYKKEIIKKHLKQNSN